MVNFHIKIIHVLFFVLIMFSQAFSHKEWVHQYQIKQAYLLLQNQMGGDIYEMKDYIGLNANGDGGHIWNTGFIVTGGWREDMEDIVYRTGSLECGLDASSTHFWNADDGDFVNTEIPWDLNLCPDGTGVPNAYEKALKLMNGGFSMLLSTSETTPTGQFPLEFDFYGFNQRMKFVNTVGQTSFYFKYNSLVDFYNTGVLTCVSREWAWEWNC